MRIVVLDKRSIGEDLEYSCLSSYGEVTLFDTTDKDTMESHLKDTDIVILNKVKIGEGELVLAPKLKLICIAATGYDNVDITACVKRGIAVTNVKGYSTNSVAQITVATVLSLASHLPFYQNYVSSGNYTKSGVPNLFMPPFYELAGKTWGIVGYGAIGKKVGEIASAFGCTVLANKRTPVEGVACVDLPTLLKQSDIVTLHVPLSPATHHLIGEKEIAMMRQGAILVNAARGAVTDEQAVAKALLSGKLGGFGTDVYSTEPYPRNHPFAELQGHPNACLTPHMAWGAYESRVKLLEEINKNISAFVSGDKRNRVD